MAKPIMRVEGMDGQIDLLPDRVVIHRQGIWTAMKYGLNARREIPLLAISEIVFKYPTVITMGEIDFVRSGRSQDEKKRGKASSAVRFRKKQEAEFETFKEKVFELVNKQAHQK